MRLIRLVSNQPTGNIPLLKSEFENYFSDNLIIKAGGKIGLLNASIPLNKKEIKITSENNEFQFRTADSVAYHTINLGGDALYTIDEFIQLFKHSSWSQLTFAIASNIGFLLNLSVNPLTSTLSLTSYRCRSLGMSLDPDFTIIKNITFAANALSRTIPPVGNRDNTAFLYSRLPALLSCSYFRVRINVVDDFVFGLTDTLNGDLALTLDDGDVKYAMSIYTVNIGTPGATTYLYYTDKDEQMTKVELADYTPANNDIFSIEIENGKVFYRVYRNTANPHICEFGDYEIDQFTPQHVVLGLRGGNVSTSLPDIFYDPMYKINNSKQIEYNDTLPNVYAINESDSNFDIGFGAMPTPPGNLNILFTLNFTKPGLREILGYETDTLAYKGISKTFVSPNPYNMLTIPSTLVIEIPTIKLNSYDGLLGTRRNILAVLPNQQVVNEERLLYSVQNPIMLDIDNQFDINLRSIRARISNGDDDGSLLEVFDRIELTLLID